MMREDNIAPWKRKSENRVPPEDKDDERKSLASRNGEDQVPPNKKQGDIEEITGEPYAEVCTFEEIDDATLFTKKNTRSTFVFG